MSLIPSTYDRADGSAGSVATYGSTFGGTAGTPAGARIVSPSPTFFYEMPTSPSIEKSEQATIMHNFVCDYGTGKTVLSAINRGSILTDTFGNVSRVLSNRLDYLKGDTCMISTTAEGVSFNVPPYEFDIEVLEFNPDIVKHPRYSGLNVANPSAPPNGYGAWQVAANLKQAVQQQLSGGFNTYLITVFNWLGVPQTTGNVIYPTNISPILAQAALELYNKMLKGETNFYLAGFRVRFSSFNFYPQNVDPGGRIEDPVDSGNLPVMFWSNDGTGNPSTNIFTALASVVSPQFYANGISWLREADSQSYQRTWFRKTESWIGGPAGGPFGNGFNFTGHWDTDIYATNFTGYNLTT
jgi:hypothetical protein